MQKILNIYKPLGLTPLQLITRLRTKRKEYQDVKIGFAGRLDPLAHGVMLLMIGDETKNRNKYLDLDKEYEFEVLLGVSTDTYDALGVFSNSTIQQFNNLSSSRQARTISLEAQIKNYINSKLGKQTQPYPPYSSKEINGKPLFQWARENKLPEIIIPEREIEVYSFELLDIKQTSNEEIHKRIVDNINRVDGDFRQTEILEKWKSVFKKNKASKFTVAKCRINCSTGTYVRSIANEMGEILNSGAIALDILRTKVGNYNLDDSIKI